MKKSRSADRSEKLIQSISEEKNRLIAELFAKPSKEKRKEIEKKILELDRRYVEMFE
ncbi:MAG: hypothetical protein HYW50_00890 [Candidatus Diapherotrites archaeon]|nr:hypothetical protein [Candidatus Diapherotrites archaeon]